VLSIALLIASWLAPVFLAATVIAVALNLAGGRINIAAATAGRAQLLAVTISAAFAYWAMALTSTRTGALPVLPASYLTIVGASQGVYVALKGFRTFFNLGAN
jgi:hypothetical protein